MIYLVNAINQCYNFTINKNNSIVRRLLVNIILNYINISIIERCIGELCMM